LKPKEALAHKHKALWEITFTSCTKVSS
jgi:hypothetical protein